MNWGYPIILAGYIGWGLFPLYWNLLTHVASEEVLLHRILWSVPVLVLFVLLSNRRKLQVMQAVRSRQELGWLCISSLAIFFNWGIYIWAVNHQLVIEASMGYFLTPLLNVITGILLFGEKLDRMKTIAISCAAAGVFYYIAQTDHFPWVGLSVAVTFAGYGFMRKRMQTNAVPGLLVETVLLLPLTLGWIFWLHHQQTALFLNHSFDTDLWLILGGPVTVLPLILFTSGSRMLPMTTVGILFYVTPSLQFLSGVFILDEAFDTDKLIGFAGIWLGLAIFGYNLLRTPTPRGENTS